MKFLDTILTRHLLCICNFFSPSYKSCDASEIENPLLCFLVSSKSSLPPFPLRKRKDPVARSATTAPKKSAQKYFKRFSLSKLTFLLAPFLCSPLQTRHLWHSCKLFQALEQSPSHLDLPRWHNCTCSQLTLQWHSVGHCPKGWVSQRKLCLLAVAYFLWTSEAQSSIASSA